MKQEELWTQEDKAKVVQEDITSLSHPKASDSDILDLISRGHITKDYEELKQFLFHLSIGSMTFPTDGKAWKDPLRYRINEIIIFYDNACGNVSFSVHFSDMKGGNTHVRHFSNIFQNLNSFFRDKKVLLYVCFESVFGSALTIEFLGSCTTCPETGLERTLANKARFRILTLRAQSAFQKITKFALQCSTSYYCANYFYPLLGRSYRVGNEPNIVDINNLIQMFDNLGLNGIQPMDASKHRLTLAKQYPWKKIQIFSHDFAILHFLSYYAFYFLDGRFPNENTLLRSQCVQTD